MSPMERFSVGVGVVSVLGVWLTGIAWWHGRATNKLIASTDQLIRSTSESTQELIAQSAANTRTILDRIDERAQERHREVMDKLDEGRAET